MRFGTCCQCTKVGQTSRSVRMGLQPTNRYENPAVGRPSACGGLSGRPDGLSITYSGFSTVRGSSRTRSSCRGIPEQAGVGRPQGWSPAPRIQTSPQEYVILPSIDDGTAGRTRNFARNAGSANPANPGPRTDARLWHRAAAQAGFRRCAPGGRELALPALQRLLLNGWVKAV